MSRACSGLRAALSTVLKSRLGKTEKIESSAGPSILKACWKIYYERMVQDIYNDDYVL